MVFDVAVLGGGASGLVCAVECARRGLSTAVIDKNQIMGKKILVTGNGRCNLTNAAISPENYHGLDALKIFDIVEKYSAEDVTDFFKTIGLYTRARDGLIYPVGNKAASVTEALRNALVKYNVVQICDFDIKTLEKTGENFSVIPQSGKIVQAKNIVIATGLKAYDGSSIGLELLKKFGHDYNKIYPALVQLKTDSAFIKGLKGVKFNGQISAVSKGNVIAQENGEILFTEYGLSGIAVMQLSRLYSTCDELSISMDFMPDSQEDEVVEILHDLQRYFADTRISAEELLGGLVDKKLGHRILKFSGIDNLSVEINKLEDKQLKRIAQSLKNTSVKITGHNGFKNAQVCGGGACLSEFNTDSLESVHEKGLYAIGEVLDCIGDCGGYNLHWAWITGIHAAKAIANS